MRSRRLCSRGRSARTQRWLSADRFALSLDVTEQIGALKAETCRHLVACGFLETESDQLIEQALTGLPGYRGAEKLEHARQQLEALRRDLLPDDGPRS